MCSTGCFRQITFKSILISDLIHYLLLVGEIHAVSSSRFESWHHTLSASASRRTFVLSDKRIWRCDAKQQQTAANRTFITPFSSLLFGRLFIPPASWLLVIAFTWLPRCKPLPDYMFRARNQRALGSRGLERELTTHLKHSSTSNPIDSNCSPTIQQMFSFLKHGLELHYSIIAA